MSLPQVDRQFAGPQRHRLTKAEQARLDAALYAIAEELHPITVRGVFYQAEVRIPDIVAKSEKGYGIVQRRLVTLRRAEVIPYEWITDGTRGRRGYTRYDSLEDFLVESASLFWRNYWATADVHVEVWLEKDALAGVIFPVVVEEWGLDLMVNRGFASITYLYEAGRFLSHLGKASHIIVLSDFDPSGKCAARKVEEGLREFAPDVEIYVHELAVTLAQIRRWKLPTRPTKIKDNTHYAGFAEAYGEGTRSVELDAIRPDRLRRLVGDAIAGLADPAEVARIRNEERLGKETLRSTALGRLRQVDDDDERRGIVRGPSLRRGPPAPARCGPSRPAGAGGGAAGSRSSRRRDHPGFDCSRACQQRLIRCFAPSEADSFGASGASGPASALRMICSRVHPCRRLTSTIIMI
jgi:hypothetical protein